MPWKEDFLIFFLIIFIVMVLVNSQVGLLDATVFYLLQALIYQCVQSNGIFMWSTSLLKERMLYHFFSLIFFYTLTHLKLIFSADVYRKTMQVTHSKSWKNYHINASIRLYWLFHHYVTTDVQRCINIKQSKNLLLVCCLA